MTFKDITIKNFKANFKNYLAYFLCSSFAITVFFIYSTLIFNQDLTAGLTNSSIVNYFIIFLLVVGIFSISFISYAHSSFIKSRDKEFALFLILGMTNKEINKLMRIENTLIGGLSLGGGLLTGTVFSRLFFLVVTNFLGLKNIQFELDYKSYLLTLVLFSMIFLLIILISKFMSRKIEISNLLTVNRDNYPYKNYHAVIGLGGIIFIILSFYLLKLHLQGEFLTEITYLPPLLIGICLLGLYLSIAYFGGTFIFLSRRIKGKYYKNLIQITELKQKFSQNKKLLFIMTLLTVIVIYFIGLIYSSYITVGQYISQDQPYHLMYVSKLDDDQIIKSKLDQITWENSFEQSEERSLNYLKAKIFEEFRGQKGWFRNVDVISQEEFNKLSERILTVEPGEAVALIKLAQPEQNQWFTDENLEIKVADKKYEFTFKNEIYEVLVNSSPKTSRFVVILNETDFAKIKNDVEPEYRGVYRLFNFKDWEQARPISESLEAFLAENIIENNDNSSLVRAEVTSRIQLFESLKQQNSVYLFLMSFIGLLFFVSSGSVLYLKLFTDLERIKIRYNKLYRIGISSLEMKSIISKELALLFFAPALLGSIIGFVFILISTTNFPLREEMLLNSAVIIGLYFAFQLSFYLITWEKYSVKIMDN